MFESCVIPASLEHEFIFAELPDLSFETDNFQPHSASPTSQSTSAPTVTIDCSGNNSCKNIEFDEDVVKTINLKCGPFGPGPNGNYFDNNVCGGMIIIPSYATCICVSTPPESLDGNTDCPPGCDEEA